MSEPGVIVQGGVEAGETGAGAVLAAGCAAEDLVTAAVGDAAEFLDVDLDGFARAGVFVAADGLACGPVRGGRGGQVVTDGMRWAVDGAIPYRAAGRAGPMRCSRRRRTACCSTVSGVRRGLWWGRLERSRIPASPACRQ
ncbi:hypothetical protein GCM10010240_34120 [Streptomyces griseoviridis]|nr:hypothetical protein GCM10010240_34120 [Streptomyces griseoviridis]